MYSSDSDQENKGMGNGSVAPEDSTNPASGFNKGCGLANRCDMAGFWGNASFAHCNLNYTLHQLRQRESAGQSPNYRTGGLGRKMQPSIFEAWVCVDQHECSSRTSVPMNDWFCWVIDERIALPKERAPQQYVPWGYNGLLKLFEKEDMKIHKSVSDKGGAVRKRGIAPRARQASGASLGYPGVGERENGGMRDVGVGRRRLYSDPTTTTTVPPTEMVDEKEESGLSTMLTKLNLTDKYLHKLESEGVDINDLKETLKHGGRDALERLLEQVGVDKALHRHRIANHLQGQ
jgi:hypothetical protein